MKKEAPENEASYFSHGLRKAAFLFECLGNGVGKHIAVYVAVHAAIVADSPRRSPTSTNMCGCG